VPDAANMPPTPRQTEILALGIWAGAVPRIWRTLSFKALIAPLHRRLARCECESQLACLPQRVWFDTCF
jgi:hypothetical protein